MAGSANRRRRQSDGAHRAAESRSASKQQTNPARTTQIRFRKISAFPDSFLTPRRSPQNEGRAEYCKDINRTGDHPEIQFTFLGYTFRPRKAVDKYDQVYVNFSPAVSRDALKAMRQTIRGWHLQLKSDKNLADLSTMFNPVLRGWQQYYGHFYGSALKPVWRSMNLFLVRWLMRKHKPLAGHKTRAAEMLRRMADGQPGAFIHWSLGFVS